MLDQIVKVKVTIEACGDVENPNFKSTRQVAARYIHAAIFS